MDPLSEQTPFEVLSLSLRFENQEQQDWWQLTAPVLGQLMLHANYEVHQQYQYLVLFAHEIIPLLGPFPKNCRSTAQRALDPLEFCRNFQQAGNNIRLMFLPQSYHHHLNRQDPFGRSLTRAVLAKLGQVSGIELDLQVYYQLASLLTLTKTEEEKILQSTGWDNLSHPFNVQNAVGMLLAKTGKVMLKIDWFLPVKSMATGTPAVKLAFDAFRKLDQGDHLILPALRPMEDYFRTIEMQPSSPSSPQTMECVAMSCHLGGKASSRLKVYFKDSLLKFDRVADVWTLGGRLNHCPGIMEGLEILRSLWTILEIQEGYHYPAAQKSDMMSRNPGSGSTSSTDPQFFDGQGLGYNFEIRPGHPWPQPKIYFAPPCLTDSKTVDAMVMFFKTLGWEEEASRYKMNLQTY
ncbi:hypothetical protein FE257_001129 [Aspergillus nanangensis]|uniref:Uncharacterized protein n=1 Tax=Aspergillus nanangensis TaxID=2582783 RepID=A0AAD4CVZ3_ASPNN|nr:hypothetical protein FE257_001129 [Aspergillus nanangensis]